MIQLSFGVLVVGHSIKIVGHISVYSVNTQQQLYHIITATSLNR